MTVQKIALAGPRGSGKSTITQHLVNNHGFEQMTFSDVMKLPKRPS